VNIPSFGYGGEYQPNLASYGYGAMVLVPDAGFVCVRITSAGIEVAEYAPSILDVTLAPGVSVLERVAGVDYTVLYPEVVPEQDEGTVSAVERAAEVAGAVRSSNVDVSVRQHVRATERANNISVTVRKRDVDPDVKEKDCG